MWVIQLIACYAALLLLLRFFSFYGLYIFVVIMIIAANIEVLKVVKFAGLASPVALGTTYFSCAYLATDVVTEYFGVEKARRGILLGFAGTVLMMLCMILAIGFQPLTPALAEEWGLQHHLSVQQHLIGLFSPTPALLTASLCSYLISQFTDVWIFSKIKVLTKTRFLWLRTNVSTMLAALLDSLMFNFLAWRLFAHFPIEWRTLIFTYILATYVIRIGIAAMGTPVIYLAKYVLPKNKPFAIAS